MIKIDENAMFEVQHAGSLRIIAAFGTPKSFDSAP